MVPFDVDTEYPTVVGGVTQPGYHGWMRLCTLISALSLPAGRTLVVLHPVVIGDRPVTAVGWWC